MKIVVSLSEAIKRIAAGAVLLGGLIALALLGPAACGDAQPLPYVGINLSGAEYASSKMALWRTKEVYPDKSVIDYFADHGMNILRLPINWQRLQPQLCGPLDSKSLAKIDGVVSLAGSRQMTTIIDLHEFGDALGKPIIGKSHDARCLADLWSKIASHYRRRTDVWFDIMNEPHIQTAAQWLPSINLSLAAIRAAGFDGRVLVEGTHWTDVTKWVGTDNESDIGDHVVDPGNNYLLELHYYFNPWAIPKEQQHAKSIYQGVVDFAPVTRWARSHKVRLFLGETGVSPDATSLGALDKTLTYMEENRDVWDGVTYFAFGGGPAGFSVYIDKPSPSPQIQVMIRHVPKSPVKKYR